MVEAQQQTYPKTVREYFEDSYRFTSSGSKVLGVYENEGKKVVVLDKTIVHPQGGGQPNDESYLKQGDIKFTVESLSAKDDVILHIGSFEPSDASFTEGSEVDCVVDEQTRRLYARVHSAGHLLDIAMSKAGRTDLKPSKGYHFAQGAYVEYIGSVEANDRDPLIASINEIANDIIKNTPAETMVFKKMCTYEEADQELAKAGGIPSYIPAGQSLRVLKLTPEDPGCPCGGTHVQHVGDIKQLTVTKITKKGKAIRVAYEVKPNFKAGASSESAPAKATEAPAKGGAAQGGKKGGKGDKGQKGGAHQQAQQEKSSGGLTQDQMYAQLLTIREGFFKALSSAVDGAESTGSAASTSAENPEIVALKAENKKLNYRVGHLLRTIDEMEASGSK